MLAFATWWGGIRHGKAEYITSVSKAADAVMGRQAGLVKHFSDRCDALEAQHDKCHRDLSGVREELHLLKMAFEEETGKPIPPYLLGRKPGS